MFAGEVQAEAAERVSLVVEHHAHGRDDGAERALARIGENAQLSGMALHLQAAPQRQRLAVDVRRALVRAGDYGMAGAHRLHQRVAAYESGHKVQTELGLLELVAGAHYRDVEHAVAYARIRRYEGVVAVLRGVAAHHQEGVACELPAVNLDGIALRVVIHKLVDGALKIREQAAAALAREMVAHGRVEAHAESAEERTAAHGAVVAGRHMVGHDDVERAVHVDRYLYVAGQAVAAAGGHYAEGHGGVAQGARRLIDGAVASAGQHSVAALLHGATGQARGVAGAGGVLGVYVEPGAREALLYVLGHAGLRRRAGHRIHYQQQLSFSFSHNNKKACQELNCSPGQALQAVIRAIRPEAVPKRPPAVSFCYLPCCSAWSVIEGWSQTSAGPKYWIGPGYT